MNKDWDSKSIDHYKTVQQIQKQLRKGNSTYLSHHPEIRAIIRVFIHEIINQKPENVYAFAANLFNCNNTPLLTRMINQELKRVHIYLKKGRYGEFDADFPLGERESTHSLLSKISVMDNANAILRYAVVIPDKDKKKR